MTSEVAGALRAARSTWDAATRDGAAACGFDVVADACTAMQDAWFAEVGVQIAALEQVELEQAELEQAEERG